MTDTPLLVGSLCGLVLLFARRTAVDARARARVTGHRPTPPLPPRVDTALADAGVPAPERVRVVVLWTAVTVGGLLMGFVVPAARLVGAIVFVGGPVALVVRRGVAARDRRAHLPLLLDAVASSLRAGSSLTVAVTDATSIGSPLADEVRRLGDDVARGARLDEALHRWSAGADDETRLVAACLRVAGTVGGPGARAVDEAARSLRERQASQAEANALAAQGRLSALVLTLAPLAFAVLLAASDDHAAHFLLQTPLGVACVATGLGLDALGAWWMHRLVGRTR